MTVLQIKMVYFEISNWQFEALENFFEVLDLQGLDRNGLLPQAQTLFAQNLEEEEIIK
jgi:hypothetical protein